MATFTINKRSFIGDSLKIIDHEVYVNDVFRFKTLNWFNKPVDVKIRAIGHYSISIDKGINIGKGWGALNIYIKKDGGITLCGEGSRSVSKLIWKRSRFQRIKYYMKLGYRIMVIGMKRPKLLLRLRERNEKVD